MATTEATPSTRDQIAALLDEGTEDASAIAEQLGVTRATVYNHLRNIRAERGEKPRKRGRPPAPKVGKDKNGSSTASRPAPPKASAKAQPPSGQTEAKQTSEAGNGRLQAQAVMRIIRRPRVLEAIRAELAEERKESQVIEQWLDDHSQ